MAKPTVTPKTVVHVAVDPVTHNGTAYAPGQVIPDLTEAQALDLLSHGAIASSGEAAADSPAAEAQDR